jgi:hypothetical protein
LTEFSITGYEILAGTRILIPVDVASIQPGISIPVTGTVSVGSVNVIIDVATVNAVVDVATIGAIASPVTIGTIQSAPLVTVGGTLSASIEYPVAIATIDNAPLVTVQGAVAASLSSPVTVAGGTIESLAAGYVFTSVSATIKGSPGILYQINVAGESGLVSGPGTLLVLDSTATLAVVPVAAGGFEPVPFGPGVNFGTLIGSIIGSIDATFVVR